LKTKLETESDLGPRWKYHSTELLSVLFDTQVILIGIYQELRKVKKLGNEFFYITSVSKAVSESPLYTVEEPISMIKFTTLSKSRET
jgi:hypothetical protein